MTLSGLVLNIGIVAIILTLIITLGLKKHKSYLMTFLQNFTGVLFIFSGWVKAIDPMGTAFKMEQYFGEFESVFSQTMFKFISPVFPMLSNISIWFSVGMIIFEIVLGIMLLFGIKPKLTAWLFFLLVVFFTILTGFTYLTGYVPSGATFFDFASWGPYKASNMKVTDCGCFGDFLKLEPKISFFKDIALLVPSIYFLFKYKDMHQLLTSKWNKIVMAGSTLLLILYCLNNFVWNEPHIDFRPFRNGADIAVLRAEEKKAQSEVQITDYTLKNLADGKIVDVPFKQYLADTTYQDKSKWTVVEQVKTPLRIPKTKISEFEITDFDGNDNTDLYLRNPKYHFMVMSPKVEFETGSVKAMVKDSIFKIDTIVASDHKTKEVKKTFLNVMNKEISKTDFIFSAAFIDDLKAMKPVIDAAKKDGHDVSVVIGSFTKEAADDLAKETGIDAQYFTADDIMLKTIMRSNPGLVLWKNGVLVQKWHKNKLPDYAAIKTAFIK
jgi:uncharacterized membrane protein YphA (DoxX/SURF4 family)